MNAAARTDAAGFSLRQRQRGASASLARKTPCLYLYNLRALYTVWTAEFFLYSPQ